MDLNLDQLSEASSDALFRSPGAVLFEFSGLTVRWYGFLIALAFLLCIRFANKLIEKRNLKISEDEFSNFAIWTILFALIGARAWFVLLHWDYFSVKLSEIVQIWQGGQSIQGGIVGAFIGTCCFQLIFQAKGSFKQFYWKHYLEKLAIVASVAPLGQAIGRWGNFFNEEAYGSVTDLPWGVYISGTGQMHHPTFLYESIANLLIFWILYCFATNLYLRDVINDLDIVAIYLFLYSFLRLLIEPMRLDSAYIGDFKAASLLALLGILIAFALFFIPRIRFK